MKKPTLLQDHLRMTPSRPSRRLPASHHRREMPSGREEKATQATVEEVALQLPTRGQQGATCATALIYYRSVYPGRKQCTWRMYCLQCSLPPCISPPKFPTNPRITCHRCKGIFYAHKNPMNEPVFGGTIASHPGLLAGV